MLCRCKEKEAMKDSLLEKEKLDKENMKSTTRAYERKKSEELLKVNFLFFINILMKLYL